jgi:hypothetical protein
MMICSRKSRSWRARPALERVAALRMSIDGCYQSARVAGEAVEMRLRVCFSTDKPRQLWHATMDLLSVRYFQVIGLATGAILRDNSGSEHSGLTVDQLGTPNFCSTPYRARFSKQRAPFSMSRALASKGPNSNLREQRPPQVTRRPGAPNPPISG